MKAALVNRHLAGRYFNDVWMVELDVCHDAAIIFNAQKDDLVELVAADGLVPHALSKLIRP